MRIILSILAFSLILISCKTNKTPSEPTQPAMHDYKIHPNVEWSSPNDFPLTMDIYVPQTGKKTYPVLIVYHGGGWCINTKSVMDSLSIYVARHSEMIVCNTNYRLLTDQNNTVTLDQTYEDAINAALWVKSNIGDYGGDPARIALTGDSAGGHLAAMVALSNQLKVNAVVPSYGVLNVVAWAEGAGETGWLKGRGFFGKEISIKSHPELYAAMSPYHLIPNAAERLLPPMLLTVGELDKVTTPESIRAFQKELEVNNQPCEYWEYEGRPHAYLDGHRNDFSGIVTEFRKDAPQALDVMIAFLEKHLKLNGLK